jgi:predicted membrane protein
MKLQRFFWGLVFILAAIWLIITQVIDIDIGISAWRILLGVVCLYILVEGLGRRSIFGILVPLAGLYWLFAPYLKTFEPPLVPLIGSVALLSIGIYILFGFGRRYRSSSQKGARCWIPSGNDGQDAAEFTVNEAKDFDGDTVYRQVSLGRSEVHLHSKNLKKGTFVCSLGDMHVYFSDAQLDPEGASVSLDCTMGSLKLYIPKNWRVNHDIEVALGDAQERYKYSDTQGPLMSVTGKVRMGLIEIIYV